MPCCNGGDIPIVRDSLRRLIFGRCLVMRTQKESVEERNANDDAGFSISAPFGFGQADRLLLSWSKFYLRELQ